MADKYGPWATLIDAGVNPQLSAFWKKRMSMLVPISRTSPVLSRRNLLRLGATVIITTVLPTFVFVPAMAEEQRRESELKNSTSGRIYIDAVMNVKSEDSNPSNEIHAIIAIDPETGQWEKVIDGGYRAKVSPDGQMIAFLASTNSDTDKEEIWTYDLKSKKKTLICNDGGNFSWAPDGKSIVFTKSHFTADDKSEDNTWSISLDGSEKTKLPITKTDEVDDWSNDGRWFVTVSNRQPPWGSGYQLYRMHPDGGEELRLTKNGLNCYPRFSPDSRKIAYLHQTAIDGNSLHVMDMDGTNDHEIVRGKDLTNVEKSCFSPDGRRLAITLVNLQLENGKKVLKGGPEEQNWRIEIVDADGKNRRELKLSDAKVIFLGHPDWH